MIHDEDDLVRAAHFILRRNKDSKCPDCDYPSMSIKNPVSRELEVIVSIKNNSETDEILPDGYDPIFRLVCMNCGYCKIYHLGVIFRLMNQEPRSEEGSNE